MIMAELSESEVRDAFHGRKPEFAEWEFHMAEI